MSCAALGALAGPPISGAIYRATHGYAAVGYYAGAWNETLSVVRFHDSDTGCVVWNREHAAVGGCVGIDHSSPGFEEDLGKVLDNLINLQVDHGKFPVSTICFGFDSAQ